LYSGGILLSIIALTVVSISISVGNFYILLLVDCRRCRCRPSAAAAAAAATAVAGDGGGDENFDEVVDEYEGHPDVYYSTLAEEDVIMQHFGEGDFEIVK
jgi:hypothetical protein